MDCPSEHPNHRLKLMGKKTLFIMVNTCTCSIIIAERNSEKLYDTSIDAALS